MSVALPLPRMSSALTQGVTPEDVYYYCYFFFDPRFGRADGGGRFSAARPLGPALSALPGTPSAAVAVSAFFRGARFLGAGAAAAASAACRASSVTSVVTG